MKDDDVVIGIVRYSVVMDAVVKADVMGSADVVVGIVRDSVIMGSVVKADVIGNADVVVGIVRDVVMGAVVKAVVMRDVAGEVSSSGVFISSVVCNSVTTVSGTLVSVGVSTSSQPEVVISSSPSPLVDMVCNSGGAPSLLTIGSSSRVVMVMSLTLNVVLAITPSMISKPLTMVLVL